MLENNLKFFRQLKNIVDFIGSTPEKEVKVYAKRKDEYARAQLTLSDFILNNNNIYEYVYAAFNFYSNPVVTVDSIYFELPNGEKIGTFIGRDNTTKQVSWQ